MKVGYCVEGSTDAAVIEGLRLRWCPHAELIVGKFRGAFRRREIPHACLELRTKGAAVIILLRDANKENWRDVVRADCAACATAFDVVVGVADRNIECWLVANSHYASAKTGVNEADFRVPDPKNAFERAMKITALERRTHEIIEYVQQAPLRSWLVNGSFEDFYDRVWQKGKELACLMENLRESTQS